jgi:hypothetical protein
MGFGAVDAADLRFAAHRGQICALIRIARQRYAVRARRPIRQLGWKARRLCSIRKFVKTARRYRTIEIQTAPSPPPTPTTSAKPWKPSPEEPRCALV